MIVRVKRLTKLVTNSSRTFESIVRTLIIDIRVRIMSQVLKRSNLQAGLKCIDIMYGHDIKSLNTNICMSEVAKRKMTTTVLMSIKWAAVDSRFRSV